MSENEHRGLVLALLGLRYLISCGPLDPLAFHTALARTNPGPKMATVARPQPRLGHGDFQPRPLVTTRRAGPRHGLRGSRFDPLVNSRSPLETARNI